MNETKQKAACSFELNFQRKQKVTNGIEVKVKEREREKKRKTKAKEVTNKICYSK